MLTVAFLATSPVHSPRPESARSPDPFQADRHVRLPNSDVVMMRSYVL